MNTIIIIVICAILIGFGIVGCFIGKIPGPIIAYIGFLVLKLVDIIPISWTTTIICGVMAVGSVVLAIYLQPLIRKKINEFGKAGNWGTFIGSLISIGTISSYPIAGCVCFFVLPFLFALLFETVGQRNVKNGLRRSLGAYLNFIATTFIKLATCVAMMYFAFFNTLGEAVGDVAVSAPKIVEKESEIKKDKKLNKQQLQIVDMLSNPESDIDICIELVEDFVKSYDLENLEGEFTNVDDYVFLTKGLESLNYINKAKLSRKQKSRLQRVLEENDAPSVSKLIKIMKRYKLKLEKNDAFRESELENAMNKFMSGNYAAYLADALDNWNYNLDDAFSLLEGLDVNTEVLQSIIPDYDDYIGFEYFEGMINDYEDAIEGLMNEYDAAAEELINGYEQVFDGMMKGYEEAIESAVSGWGSFLDLEEDVDVVGARNEGKLCGLFSVSPTKTVCFSQGNLEYQSSTGTWRFAEYQYDIVGDGNANVSSSYSGWIDLFGWATSGYSHGAYCYQPWSTSEDYNNYVAYGNVYQNLYNGSGMADWGYNKIVNGGNMENMWRTLTSQEWEYLLEQRPGAANKHGHACVEDMTGVVLLPDNWSTPEGCSFVAGCGKGFYTNSYSRSQWELMQLNGAVFLPAAGSRSGVETINFGLGAGYWTSSRNDEKSAYSLRFNKGYVRTSTNRTHNGYSVRLVRDN